MSFKEIIEQYLQQYAAKDEAFALKLQNPSKNIDTCIKYIYGEVCHKYVKEHKGVQIAAPTRDEVFGMAVHYYDEDAINIRPMNFPAAVSGSVRSTSNSRAKKSDKETIKKTAKVAENAPKREAKQPKPKTAKKTVDEDAFFGSLFDASMFE